jgi:hypothetical protein
MNVNSVPACRLLVAASLSLLSATLGAGTLASCANDSSGNKKKDQNSGTDKPPGQGGPAGSDQQVTISGSLILPQQLAGLLSPVNHLVDAIADQFDEVWSVPMNDGFPMLSKIAKARITDGKFSIETPKNDEAVLVLVNSLATGSSESEKRLNQVVRFLAFEGGDKDLIRLPIPEASSAAVDMGSVTVSQTSAVSSKSVEDAAQSEFTVTPSKLTEFARTNDGLKNLKNTYANTDGPNYVSYAPVFAFEGDTNLAQETFSPPESTVYSGYIVFVNIVDGSLTLRDICSKGKLVELVPPVAIAKSDNGSQVFQALDNSVVTEDSSSDASSASPSCGGGEMYAKGGGTNGPVNINWGGSAGFTGGTSTGIWKFKVDGNVRAAFDIASISPVNAEGKPVVYIPQLKIEKNTEGIVTKVSVKLKMWDAALGEFRDPSDIATLNSLLKMVSINLVDYSKRETCTFPKWTNGEGQKPVADESGGYSLAVPTSENWRMTAGADSCQAGSIAFNYTVSGLGYMFDFRDRGPN